MILSDLHAKLYSRYSRYPSLPDAVMAGLCARGGARTLVFSRVPGAKAAIIVRHCQFKESSVATGLSRYTDLLPSYLIIIILLL